MFCGSVTFVVEEESSLCQTRLTRLEANKSLVRLDAEHLLSEGSTVLEEDAVTGRYLEELVTLSTSLDVQFEVVDDQADRLRPLDDYPPAALRVHVVLTRIVGTGQVSAVVETRVRTLAGAVARVQYAGGCARRNLDGDI